MGDTDLESGDTETDIKVGERQVIGMDSLRKIDIDRLWREFKESKDPDIKNQILIYYVPLVEKIVRRIMPKYKEYNESDDLISCGIIGLIDALEKYDISYGVKFETYASARIRGEIIDYMRKQDWAPSSFRKKINSINQVIEHLENELGRYPSDAEIAKRLNMSVSEVQHVLEKTHMFNLMYFEDMVTDTLSVEKMTASSDDDPEVLLQEKETKRILAEIIASLPEKERLVITLFYYEELTLKEIAGILKVSESRVSQIHSKVLGQIGHKFKRAT
jgi:RNA polymerase sigma factor for flagellar operon FliA